MNDSIVRVIIRIRKKDSLEGSLRFAHKRSPIVVFSMMVNLCFVSSEKIRQPLIHNAQYWCDIPFLQI